MRDKIIYGIVRQYHIWFITSHPLANFPLTFPGQSRILLKLINFSNAFRALAKQ